jgi:hypothetical protein
MLELKMRLPSLWPLLSLYYGFTGFTTETQSHKEKTSEFSLRLCVSVVRRSAGHNLWVGGKLSR